MSSLFDLLSNQLGGDAVGQISRQIGADEESTTRAISGALPLTDLLNTEKRQAERTAPREFSMLESLLDRDGDGQVIDDVASIATSVLGNLFRPR